MLINLSIKIRMVVINSLYFSLFLFAGVSITLGTEKEFPFLNGNSLLIECILNSGNVDHTTPRSWGLNGTTLISDGILSTAGSGYNEIVGTDRFSLSTPMLDYSFDAAIFQCNYGFFQAILISKIYGKISSFRFIVSTYQYQHEVKFRAFFKRICT